MSITIETADRIMRIGMHRPEKKNALTVAMYEALEQGLARAEADAGVRVVVVHGQEDCFSAGNDLADFLARPAEAAKPALRFIARLAVFPKPLIAAVAGPAVGIGTTMCLHCDLVYAAANARFALSFAALGLVPEAGSSLLLPLIAGHQRAAEAFLLAEPFDAAKAASLGFVNEVVTQGSVMERALLAAGRIATLPPAAIRATKALLKAPHREGLRAQIDAEGRVFGERLASPEAQEAMQAFLERRKPDFSRF